MIEVLAGTYGMFVCLYGLCVNDAVILMTGFLIMYLAYKNMKE